MGRVAKKAPEVVKVEEDSPIQTITQTRAKRTPKPNPKYANESIIATPKIESSESNGSTDIELKLPESKIVKSNKKVISSTSSDNLISSTKSIATKTPIAAKGKGVIKKQKIDFDDDERTKDADEIPVSSPTPRTTRSGKGAIDIKESEIKIGNDSVAIVDVSSIILTSHESPIAKDEPTKVTRGSAGRKRQAIEEILDEEPVKEESPKKKKEEEKASLITTRKSYMPVKPIALDIKEEEEEALSGNELKTAKNEELEVDIEVKKEPIDAEKLLTNTAIKTRRSATTLQTPEISPEKKAKIEVVKPILTKNIPEPKKLPVMVQRKEITKIISPNVITKVNNTITVVANAGRTAPPVRLLNTMVTPKGAKETLNVKLAGDGTDRKVFSIEMSDGSITEKKKVISVSPTKSPSTAVKENIAVNKPQPSVLLKNKLESELSRMKASANSMKRNVMPMQRNIIPHHIISPAGAGAGARRVTKFESWYVIDVKNQEAMPTIRHSHTFSLIQLGNNIKEIQMPSEKWEYKITLQKRIQKNNNTNDEVYNGEITEKIIIGNRQNYEPNCILFKRSHKDNNRVMIDRSLMFKQNMFAITMNGKQCQLVGAPNDIKDLEDIELLLQIIDSCSAHHPCVELNC